MEKQIVLYNLASHMTEQTYTDYVLTEKGSLLEGLSTVKKYELVKITQSDSGTIPYNYVGIVSVSSLMEFGQKDAPSPAFQGFIKKWQPMVKDALMLSGIQIY
jgi:hypothetical protein